MLCARVLLAAPRLDMDSTDEPQRKIFRARKTMKVSDRQQLEAVYKVKEDSLNTMEVTLLNGKHENGDPDASLSDTDCFEIRPELSGMLDICLDHSIENVDAMEEPNAILSDCMEKRRASQDPDLASELELLPTEQSLSEQAGTSNTPSMEVGGQELDHNKDIHSNAGNGANTEGLDQRENEGFLFGSEHSCEKEFIEEQMESGSVETGFLSVEEMVLKEQPEEVVVAEKELEEAQPEENLMKDQEPVEEQPLHDREEAAHDPQLVETAEVPQQKELLEEKPEEILAGESQQNLVVPSEPQGDMAPTEEMEVAVVQETQLEEVQVEGTQPGGKVEEVLKQQQPVDGLEPEMGPVERPQLKVGPAQEPQMEAGLVEDPRLEEDLTEDQLLEELAEEQQFGEELAEDHLLDELVEDQRPEDVLEKCEESKSMVKDEQEAGGEGRVEVAEEGGNKEKLEIQEKTEDQSVVVEETPEVVVVEEQDLEVVKKQEMKEPVTSELVVETPKAKEALKQKSEEQPELTEDKAEAMQCNWDMEQENTVLQEMHVVEGLGDEAISSSMEIDQDSKADNTTDRPKPLVDLQGNGCGLENSDSMETEDIIPILEKLAPMKARLNSFSQPPVLSEVNPGPELEDQVELSQGSSKQEHKNNLPSEAFLVLSDEEDPCIEVPEKEVQLKPSSPTEKVPVEVAEKETLTRQDAPNKEDPPPERSEATQRKRSKSDDIDCVQSKRRRYRGEEAELQLKITTRASMDQKLQKVIQKLLQEKLCALQCADFDKALADLKTRVEQIECTKHERVLSGLQAKIARLLKRFGAAKEDMKKKQETQAAQPVQPVQPVSQSKAAGDGASSSLANRHVGAGQQMPETKRSVGDAPAPPVQVPTSAGPPPLTTQQTPQLASNQPLQRMAQTPSLQSPVTGATPARPMPDWKLIQQRINATNLTSPQPKPQTPVTATQAMAPVLSSPTTTAVVGTSQVSGGNGQPVSVSLQSLQSLPMILHLPVMQNTMQNGTVMQSTTGTLVTNRQSGKMEFIPSQNQANVGNLQKVPVSLASTIVPKPNNIQSLPNPMQRNSPASAAPSGPTLSVYGVSTSHSVAQPARTSLATVSASGLYTTTTTNSRTPMQMKAPSSSLTSPTSAGPPAAPRAEIQLNRTPPTETTVAKRAAESSTQSGKAGGGGCIDLTLDDEDGGSSQDPRKANPVNTSGITKPPLLQLRPSQPPQTSPMQSNSMPAGLPSQTSIQMLPTAPTTVNVNHRPMTQAMPRLSAPRTPTSHQVVYTTLPNAPIQTPVRNAIVQGQNQGLRQVSPQTGGVTIRIPQTTAYMVNNGMTIRSGGPQLTVQHRPPQVHFEPARPIHPAPLPEAPQPQHLPPEAASTSPPQKPHLKLARVQSQNGIVLSWSVLEVDRRCASVDSYHLYAYHEDPIATTPSQWKKVGEVKALPLPMACTLTQFVSGSKYYFAVRAKDVYGRFGVFCDPQSTDVIATQNS